jgi:hypothetical protein
MHSLVLLLSQYILLCDRQGERVPPLHRSNKNKVYDQLLPLDSRSRHVVLTSVLPVHHNVIRSRPANLHRIAP